MHSSEEEIVDAVIKAINPGIQLRNYLESIGPALTLPRLRKILRSHYQEKNAIELHHSLATVHQKKSEDAQSFVLRTLNLRQKLLFATQEAGTKIKYDNSVIQSLFRHAVETGLQDDAIRARIRPMLQQDDVDDDELLIQVGLAAATETERKEKLKSHQASCSATTTASPPSEPSEGQNSEASKKNKKQGSDWEERILAALHAVQQDVSKLQEEMRGSGSTGSTGSQKRGKPERYSSSAKRGCESCQANSRGEECNHCWKCGSSEHWARGCRVQKAPMGNSGGVLPRDK